MGFSYDRNICNLVSPGDMKDFFYFALLYELFQNVVSTSRHCYNKIFSNIPCKYQPIYTEAKVNTD